MSFNFSPKIVTNGLVAYYDAANPKSYISGSTTWTDIIDRKHLDTISGTSFSSINNGTMVFDGNDYVGTTQNIDTGSNFTVSVWMNAALLGTARRTLVANSYNFIGRNGWFFCTAGGSINNTFFMSIGADIGGVQGTANFLTPNTWYYLTATVANGGGICFLYINDTLMTNVINIGPTSGGTITYTHNQFNIGARNIGVSNDFFTGNISLVQIYNRVLTQEEITQNYNTTKSRYIK